MTSQEVLCRCDQESRREQESESLWDDVTEEGRRSPDGERGTAMGLCGLEGIVIWQYKGKNAKKEYVHLAFSVSQWEEVAWSFTGKFFKGYFVV